MNRNYLNIGLVFLLFFNLKPVYSTSYHPSNFKNSKHIEMEKIIINSIYEELFELTKGLDPSKEFQHHDNVNSQNGRGKKILEMIKQKNREKIARMNGFDPSKVKSGKDIVNLGKSETKELIVKMHTMPEKDQWVKDASSELLKLKKKVLMEHKDWKKSHLEKFRQWEKEQKSYKELIESYEKNLTEIKTEVKVKDSDMKKKVDITLNKEFYIVSNSMDRKVYDQKFRPTCSSFAGVNAVEILLSQNSVELDLSEQYFYWSSKKDCQNSKCSKKGSWVGHGFEFSKKSKQLNLPLEKNCPYNEFPVWNNETQIPLKSTCLQGAVRVSDFHYAYDLNSIIKLLNKNHAVIASLKLTPNFYTSNSVIMEKNKNIGQKMDSHAQGHTILIIGHMKIPKVLNEGSLCFIVKNSWGEGWGQAGYSCLTEKWLLAQRQSNPFTVVDSAQY